MPPAPPTLDELSIGGPIGRGATCAVRVASATASVGSSMSTSQPPEQRFALKIIVKAKIVGQNQLTRLFREKELLGELNHPNIVQLHGTLKDDSHLYFLLELLTGGELLWHMRRAPRQCVPPGAARTCVGALLLPLRYMQEQGVLYRDLKPTNVMFERSGKLKLVDFGHAKHVEPGERSLSLCGTPHYHAPEAVRGEGHGLPAQLWALGVLLVEMTAGEAPFWVTAEAKARGDNMQALILRGEPNLGGVPDDEARDLAAALLAPSADEREAAFPRGYQDVMGHPWLAALDWVAVEAGSRVPDSFDFEAASRDLSRRLADAELEAEEQTNSAADAAAAAALRQRAERYAELERRTKEREREEEASAGEAQAVP